MTERPFSGLTPAQVERLAVLVEELGECAQAAAKVLRHGYDSYHPATEVTNVKALERELGDVRFAVTLLLFGERSELSQEAVDDRAVDKAARAGRYLHHQDDSLLADVARRLDLEAAR